MKDVKIGIFVGVHALKTFYQPETAVKRENALITMSVRDVKNTGRRGVTIFKHDDDRYGVVLEYGKMGHYLYFDRHEVRKMIEELKAITDSWDKDDKENSAPVSG